MGLGWLGWIAMRRACSASFEHESFFYTVMTNFPFFSSTFILNLSFVQKGFGQFVLLMFLNEFNLKSGVKNISSF